VHPAFFLVLLALLVSPASADDTLTLAVASNFSRTAAELAEHFTDTTGIEVRISNGSTGRLYAQIINGAPYDVFLSADAERPALLVESGHAVARSRFTYATGELVLWSREAKDCLATLKDASAGRVAMANPVTAPYGRAALEFLQHDGYWTSVESRAVYGENVMQTLQFAATGNAALAIVARPMLTDMRLPAAACTWPVPASAYAGIEQQAVLLVAGNSAAVRFVEFLRSADAREIIMRHGYGVTP
jgi:molybdate transport system substrate-binding protein